MSETPDGNNEQVEAPAEPKRQLINWDDPKALAGNGPSGFPKWLLPVILLMWIGWVGFMVTMMAC